MRILKSGAAGTLAAFSAGVIAFALSRFFDAFSLFIAPSRLVSPVIEPLVPDSVIYWLVPNGGAPAGVLLIMFGAFLFWSAAFGAVHFAWMQLRVNQSQPSR
jgi:hypothetical protein